MNLEQRVALVTGASRGIGQAIARELGRRGATVVGTATSESGAAAISEYLADAYLHLAESSRHERVLTAAQELATGAIDRLAAMKSVKTV